MKRVGSRQGRVFQALVGREWGFQTAENSGWGGEGEGEDPCEPPGAGWESLSGQQETIDDGFLLGEARTGICSDCHAG